GTGAWGSRGCFCGRGSCPPDGRHGGRFRLERCPPLMNLSVVIVGGSSRAAIDLALELASAGLGVVLHDVESQVVATMNYGSVPELPLEIGHRLVENLAAGS